MSESSNLVLYMNKMMEAYAEVEEEVVQEKQSREMQEEERAEARVELEQPEEESRKRKRGDKEAEREQRNERARILVSDKAFALLEISLKDRGFIVERGFNKLISSFSEMLENRGWQSLGEHKALGCAAWVKEFFANMVEEKGKKVYIKGKWVDFSKETMNELFNLNVQKDGSKCKRLLKELEY